jgi:hypothetical protein
MRVVAFILALTFGCAGPTATIHRTDATPTEARIDSSNRSTLWLRGPSGNIVGLDQSQVASIDHPGNVMAVFAGFWIGVGVLFLAPVAAEHALGRHGNGGDEVATFVGVSSLFIGLPILFRNLLTWDESRARARAFEDARPPPWMIGPAVRGRARGLPPIPGQARQPANDEEDPGGNPPGALYR